MMTVEEEVARAVQIANAPQKVTSRIEEVTSISSSTAEEVTNRSASKTAAPVQMANAPQKVTSSRGAPSAEEVTSGGSSKFEPNAQKVLDRSASKTAAPLISPPPVIKSPGSVAVHRSSAFSLCGNSEVDVEEPSGGKEGAKKIPVKLKRPRDAQLEGTVACTDCGIQFHWASLARHRKVCNLGAEPLLESGGIRGLITILIFS